MYQCIGIMTGNSLDAVDVVLTKFEGSKMEDVCGYTLDIPSELSTRFRTLKQQLSENGGNIETIAADSSSGFTALHDDYIRIVAQAVNQMIAQEKIDKSTIDLIGFHGQTCAHCPPSIAKSKDPRDIYTLQIGSGQMLADLTGIPVAYDFRSDDVMNLGEGAPLAPVHNQHIAADLKTKGIFPVVFCNAGNTGNLAVISEDTRTGQETVMGWDTGPFNHLIDYLCRTELNQPFDRDGKFGSQGKVNYDLLRELFNNAVITKDGENFLLKTPPKSSDPAWYKIIPGLVDKTIPVNDRIRTAEFFSAYAYSYTQKFIPEQLAKPEYYLVFGGGWKNPLAFNDFKSLVRGGAEVLPEHQEVFEAIKRPNAVIDWSDRYGYNGQYMEARIFADMAKCCLTKEPFSYPSTTGCKKPTVGGIIARPGGHDNRRWSRAAKGWYEKSLLRMKSRANSAER